MATIKTACGDCGASISDGDRFCPQCGARIDRSTANLLPGTPSSTPLTRCGTCGNTVSSEAAFCESCGTALKGASKQSQQPAKTGKVQKKSGGGQGNAREKGNKKTSFEPWQIMTGILLAGLIAFFAYTEFSRQPAPTSSAPPQMFPAQSAASMQDIERLQQAVDTNPNDDASLLRLANMLQDASRE